MVPGSGTSSRFSFPLLILGACAGHLAAQPQASQLRARHQAGQTLLTFAEVQPLVTTETIAAVLVRDLRREAERSGRSSLSGVPQQPAD